MIVGCAGQLGRALLAAAPKGIKAVGYDSGMLDITDAEAVDAAVAHARPAILFNAAAYTAVDRAEGEEDKAFAINATGVGHLARATDRSGALLVQISTDFVFDGLSSRPYLPDSPTAPLGAYGRSKRAGEVAAGDKALIVRTAWLYGPHGDNFVRSMLGLMTERPMLRVVSDQIGTPTYAPGLAAALWTMALSDARGVHHCTDAGVCSWYDFAIAVQEEALAVGLLTKAVPILPIDTVDYPTPARRPFYSVLDKKTTFDILGSPTPHWRTNLRKMMGEVQSNG